MTDRIFTLGECPVCFGAGAVVVLARRRGAGLVFCCPACGCAWTTPPQGRIDECRRPQDLAPDGLRLPREDELCGLDPPATMQDVEPWHEELNVILT